MTDAMNETRHIRDTTRAPRALHPQDTPNTPDVTNTKNTPRTENTEHTQNTRRTQDTRRVEPDTSHTGDVAPAQNGLDGELETRWREIKAGFVDHPRQSVEQADELVDEALRQFTTRHRNLLDQWKSGDESDTETLRLALRDYHNLLLQLTGK
ncbi:hypothetical protein ACQP1K_17835 [Sphaerimonospora sp. CA-214678]|uniref:hypothetical protein n=1 Tax=Sphaerimonospora sp. CA-214678 TaxID=3240029 RepID=UPI003D8B07AF